MQDGPHLLSHPEFASTTSHRPDNAGFDPLVSMAHACLCLYHALHLCRVAKKHLVSGGQARVGWPKILVGRGSIEASPIIIAPIGNILCDVLFNSKYASCEYKVAVAIDSLGNIVWICLSSHGTSADVLIWDREGPKRLKGSYMDYEIGSMDRHGPCCPHTSLY